MGALVGVSIIIGVFLGMLLMLLLVWIAYATRTVLFTYCPVETNACTGSDYFNDPGNAIAAGANPDYILFLNDQNQLYYQRVIMPNVNCVPFGDQTIHVVYPQYCSFTTNTGETLTGKNTGFASPVYIVPTLTFPVVTDGDCDPIPNPQVVSGIPLIRWDSN